ELGHAVLDHFAIPMPNTATFEDVGGRLVDRPTQLKLYIWCRAAELSADRAARGVPQGTLRRRRPRLLRHAPLWSAPRPRPPRLCALPSFRRPRPLHV